MEQASQNYFAQAKRVFSFVAIALVLIIAIDFAMEWKFAVLVDQVLQAIHNAVDTTNEYFRSASWRPWFYLLGTVGVSTSFYTMREGRAGLAFASVAGTLILGILSFVVLDNADPGRVHRYQVWLVISFYVFSMMLAVPVLTTRFVNNVDDRNGLIAIGMIAVTGIGITLWCTLNVQEKFSRYEEVSVRTEKLYGAELRAMRFEDFSTEDGRNDWWMNIYADGLKRQVKAFINLRDPDNHNLFLVEDGFEFEIGMVDNKPVVMTSSANLGKVSREKMMTSLEEGIEKAMLIIREQHQKNITEKRNQDGWRSSILGDHKETNHL